jgi:hypothetical protein
MFSKPRDIINGTVFLSVVLASIATTSTKKAFRSITSKKTAITK